MNYVLEQPSDKMHSLDRVIVLKLMDGKTAINSKGATDNRLFTGENKLHAVYDNAFGLWALNYDKGQIPGGLEGKFTDLTLLVNHVKQYFATRNIEVVEVRD